MAFATRGTLHRARLGRLRSSRRPFRLRPWELLPEWSPNATSPQPAGHHRRLLPRWQHTGEARTQSQLRRTPSILGEPCSRPTDGRFVPSFSPATNPLLGWVAPSGGGRRTLEQARPMPRPRHGQERTCGGASREGRDDLCGSRHDLPGITAGLLSLAL